MFGCSFGVEEFVVIYRKFGKRLFDIILSGLGLLLLSPIFLSIMFLVRINLGKPVFFKQERPGFHAEPFTMIKFRTMTSTIDSNGKLLLDEERLTKFGRFLRSTSLDELPELWNVLKGEMSLVGPRPLLLEYLPLYSKEQFRRHEVRPGITGFAQVNGRNAIRWSEKFNYDLKYVDNFSLFFDLNIIFKTFFAVIKRDGIYASEVSNTPFRGDNISKNRGE